MALLKMYTAVKGFIEAIQDSDGNAVFKTVHLWNSQPLNEEGEKPDCYPAVYIHFDNIPWRTDLPQGGFNTDITEQQTGDAGNMILHIVHSSLDDESIAFEEIHPLNEKVYFAVQNKSTEDYGPLIRTLEIHDVNHDRLIDWQMHFRFTLIQTGQVVDKTTVPAGTLALTVESNE